MNLTTFLKLFNVSNNKNIFITLIVVCIVIMIIAFIVKKKMNK